MCIVQSTLTIAAVGFKPSRSAPCHTTTEGQEGIVRDRQGSAAEPALQLLVQSQHVDGLGVDPGESQAALRVVFVDDRLIGKGIEPRDGRPHVSRQAGTLYHNVIPHGFNLQR